MVKSDLIKAISVKMGLPYPKAEAAVDAFFNTLTNGLADGKRAEIRGFGSFSSREYASYTGRNPRTGDPVDVAPKILPYFKMGKDMRDAVNRK